MHCFCLDALNKNGNVAPALTTLREYDPNIDVNPCEDWYFYYQNSFVLIIISGAAVGLINTVAVMIFEILGPFERCLTHA